MSDNKSNDNLLVAVFVLASLIAAAILDRPGGDRTWHPAIFWTAVTFSTLCYHFRRKWKSATFWLFWFGCLVVHACLMWLIFAWLLSGSGDIGMLYTFPFAVGEFLFLVICFPKIEGKIGAVRE